MAELKHATEQPGYASVAWRAYCDTLAARVKELEAALDAAIGVKIEDSARIADCKSKLSAVTAQRDELLELIKVHGSICGTCMCGASFLPSGNGHCDNHAYTDMFDHYSRKLIAKIEAEKKT